MSSKDTKSVNWTDTLLRILIPGILIAFAGFMGEWAMSSISNTQENARLVTNLQIQREQAESVLRKDIFNQSLSSLLAMDEKPNTLDPEISTGSSISYFSKRLLKLELLSLNFGDSLSLSPFFTDFERDLRRLGKAEGVHLNDNEEIRIGKLRDRLRSLARRVAQTQTASLSQYGVEKSIQVPLLANGSGFAGNRDLYIWPDDRVLEYLPDGLEREDPDTFHELCLEEATVELEGRRRYLGVAVSNPNAFDMKVRIDLSICSLDALDSNRNCPSTHPETVIRDFSLDYFNFPKIDNTRLSKNQRVSLVLQDFPKLQDPSLVQPDMDPGELPAEKPTLEISVIFFSSEYASLRDRPSMREALELLDRAQQHEDPERQP